MIPAPNERFSADFPVKQFCLLFLGKMSNNQWISRAPWTSWHMSWLPKSYMTPTSTSDMYPLQGTHAKLVFQVFVLVVPDPERLPRQWVVINPQHLEAIRSPELGSQSTTSCIFHCSHGSIFDSWVNSHISSLQNPSLIPVNPGLLVRDSSIGSWTNPQYNRYLPT